MRINAYSSKDEVLTEIGERIKASRISMSISQKEMAERTNLSQRTISNLENGKDVSFSTIIEVLRELGQLQSLELMIPAQVIRPSQIVELGKPRERVSSKRKQKEKIATTWKWGDEK